MRTGLFGGAFNPIHNGHLAVARAAIRVMQLDRLIIIPSGHAPHKTESTVSRIDRLNMVQLAVENEEKMEVSRYEIDRHEVSYSADTVEYFMKLYPMDELFFLIGDDSYNDLSLWYEPSRITAASTLLVFPRVGASVKPPAIEIPMERVRISSSKIREEIKRRKDVSNLLPKPVFDYIIEKNLYMD